MQLAISTYSLARWRRENHKTLEQSLDWIASTGVPAVEFAGLDEKAAANPIRRATALRKCCEKVGLKIVSYCVPAELFVPPVERMAAVDKLKQHVDVAKALGVTWVRHDVTRGPAPRAKPSRKKQPTLDAVIAATVPSIIEVTEYAHSKGIRTSVENHGYYMQASVTVEKLLNAVGHKNFGLTLDMGNFMVVGEDPVLDAARFRRSARGVCLITQPMIDKLQG